VPGEDRTIAREAKTRNTRERSESLLQFPVGERLKEFARRLDELDELPEDTIEQVRTKTEAYRRIESSPEFEGLHLACNIWTAGFFQNFSAGPLGAVTTDVLRKTLTTGSVSDGRLTGWIEATAQERRFFHWPLAFPEVFATGGFDVFVGNPPFLGGLKISSEFGNKYRHWVSTAFAPFPGTADLCAAFFRRAFCALNAAGRFGLIATNTISQGDTRQAGLGGIRTEGGSLVFAERFVKWPGQATVEVNLLAASRRAVSSAMLDGQSVREISTRLDEEPESEPQILRQNQQRCFIGAYVRGIGFVIEAREAEGLLANNRRNRDCLFPYLVGEDINLRADQSPSRWVIDFHDWTFDQAAQYPELLRIVDERVRPERLKLPTTSSDYRKLRDFWWRFARSALDLRAATTGFDRVLVRAVVSDTHALCFVPIGWIFAHKVVAFAFEDHFHFALLQSNLHESWMRRFTSTMRTDVNYSPTDCFETFAFPQAPPDAARREAERVGETYYEYRRQTMLSRQLGLTKTYNLFHKAECGDADIARLRELHATMDRAILACYGWTDIDPGHGFHQNERGQTRYTISPTARREILRHLLALNLEIAAHEAAGGLAASDRPLISGSGGDGHGVESERR
jgi:hypothetical protein